VTCDAPVCNAIIEDADCCHIELTYVLHEHATEVHDGSENVKFCSWTCLSAYINEINL
jgi:hypothetical protein